MQKLCNTGSLQEAYLLLHRLEQAGIEARVLNEHAQGGVGQLPFTHTYPEVWLLEPTEVGRARAILEEYERARKVPLANRRCAACGEDNPGTFDVCWRCGSTFER